MTAWAYYGDVDPYVCAWAKNLIAAGLVPDGEVDCRSIADVCAADLRGFRQCHFFAGILGWPLALRLAGWDDDRPVWTGSAPCQPFSAAGARQAGTDKRHLWPRWLRLVGECRPDTIFGEQVEGAVGLGWLDRVFADLEDEGYACGAAVLGAHSVGAPHIRQRLFWVADATSSGTRRDVASGGNGAQADGEVQAGGNSCAGRLADAEHADRGANDVDRPDVLHGRDGRWPQAHRQPRACGEVRRLGDAALDGRGNAGDRAQGSAERSGAGVWSDCVWLPCLDGKARRVESSIRPLAHSGEWGTGSRMGMLRAAGNAIVPAIAAEFVAAAMECPSGCHERGPHRRGHDRAAERAG